MEANGKVGVVKMKPLYALKKMCEEYSIDRVIGGGLVKRYEMVIDNTIKNKEQELENNQNKAEGEIDNSMFGQEVLEELGITKEKSGEYVMAGKQENQEQKQDDELLL